MAMMEMALRRPNIVNGAGILRRGGAAKFRDQAGQRLAVDPASRHLSIAFAAKVRQL